MSQNRLPNISWGAREHFRRRRNEFSSLDSGYNTEYTQVLPTILRIFPDNVLNYYSIRIVTTGYVQSTQNIKHYIANSEIKVSKKLTIFQLQGEPSTATTTTLTRFGRFLLTFDSNFKIRVMEVNPGPFGSATFSSSNSNKRFGAAAGAGVALFFRFFFAGLHTGTLELLEAIWSRAALK